MKFGNIMKRSLGLSLFITIWMFSSGLHAEGATFTIDQKGKTFSQNQIKIKVGDTIKFTNSDPLFHNIYSISDPAPFDLGAYTRGAVREYTFTKPGKVEVGCVIHQFMHLTIEVE